MLKTAIDWLSRARSGCRGVFPDMFSLAWAHEAMKDGALKDPMLAKLLDGMVERWVAEGRES